MKAFLIVHEGSARSQMSERCKQLVVDSGGEVVYEGKRFPVAIAKLSTDGFGKLAVADEIRQISPSLRVVRPTLVPKAVEDGICDIPWGVRKIKAVECWEAGITGDGVICGVIDTGIDRDHPDLVDAIAGGIDLSLVDQGIIRDDFDDVIGHGTHVSGTIAARGKESGVVGVAHQAMIYMVKVFTPGGFATYGAIMAGIDHLVAQGASVISMSIGGPVFDGPIDETLEFASLAGVFCVAAAGNNFCGGFEWIPEDPFIPPPYTPWNIFPQLNTYDFPAWSFWAQAVGAVDEHDFRASFSSTGDAVEISAPGHRVYSTFPDNSYAILSGTSMACPHVAGVGCLLTQAGVVGVDPDGVVKQRRKIIQTPDPVPLRPKYDFVKDFALDMHGYGLVNAARACSLAN